MWSTSRADAARRELLALCAVDVADLDVADLHAAAIGVLSRVVRYDATCWATVDPSSGAVTGQLTIDFDPTAAQEALFVDVESSSESNTFTDLIGRQVEVARLSDLAHREVVSSRRINELYRPMGFAHEIRLVMSARGLAWGVAGLLRAPGSDFTDEETTFLRDLSGVLGEATRQAVIRASSRDSPGSPDRRGAVVILLGQNGQFRAATPAAMPWLEGPDAARFAIALRAAAATAASSPSGSGQLRVRDQHGRWVTLTASPLLAQAGDPATTAISIESASGRDLADILAAGYGLTSREREICALVTAGRSTGDIAAELFLSSYTVQDHLKSIFAKTSVRSRRELILRLNPSPP